MKGKDVLKSLIEAGRSPEVPNASAPQHRPAGAIKSLNMSLNRLSKEAAEAKHLREALANTESVVELSPTAISSSMVSDRLSPHNDRAFEDLKTAIELSGQQVPVLVRPLPGGQGRYQAAYGHRRIRAALDLGRNVRAIIRNLTDAEMVIAQGQENGQRVDLSFIERAVFASNLDAQNFDRNVVCASLGVDKPEASRLLTVASAIDRQIIEAIGAAPKVGRPRWLQFAEALKPTEATDRVRLVLDRPEFRKAESDERFKLAFDAAARIVKKAKLSPTILKVAGKKVASYGHDSKKWTLTTNSVAFAVFIQSKLNGLVKEFETAKKDTES